MSAGHRIGGGYGDAVYPDGADILGGVIKSCMQLYNYTVLENCLYPGLSSACIATAAKDGSLQAQFYFGPLQSCMDHYCVSACSANKNTQECMEKCLFKNCTFEFMGCIASGESGPMGCPDALTCLDNPQYKDKFQTLSLKCFGAATLDAQKKMANFWSCAQPPHTDSCMNHVAACYGSTGQNSCSKVLDCMNLCADDPCRWSCVGNAKKSSQLKLDTFVDCVTIKCSGKSGPCIASQCNNELLACQLDT